MSLKAIRAVRTCPTCGSKRVHRRSITKQFRNGREVRNVPVDECDACGERVYDPGAMAMLAPALKAAKARRA